MQPVDRTFRDVFRHAFDGVIIRPAIMTIEIALPLRKQIRNDRPQLSGVPARLEIRLAPRTPRSQRAECLVLTLRHFRRVWVLRIHWLGQNLLWFRLERRSIWLFVEYLVKLLIDSI